MSDKDLTEREQQAAEYVLGTLRGPARRQFEAELAGDAALRRSVAAWEEHLAGLADTVEPMPPSESIWQGIETRLDAAGSPAADVRTIQPDGRGALGRLWDSLGFWRLTTGLATAGALALAVVVARPPPPPPPTLIAVLSGEKAPAFAVRFAASGPNVTPVGRPEVAGDRDLELWVVAEGSNPVSIGLIGEGGVTPLNLDGAAASLVKPGVLLAVSLEPAGGSPTRQPTGPILYTGTLVEVR